MSASPTGRLATARDRLSSAIATSRLVAVAGTVETTLSRWGRGSRIVRWFVAEPVPGPVMVGLRESYTVGPPIRLLTWARGRTRRLVARAGLDATAGRTGRVEAAPVRWLGIAVATAALAGALVGAVGSGEIPGWPLLVLGVAVLATRERRSAAELADSPVGRAVVAAFDAPDAPGRGDG